MIENFSDLSSKKGSKKDKDMKSKKSSKKGDDGPEWGPCEPGSDVERFGAECASIDVPLDYSKPKGKTIRLALSRIQNNVTDPEDYKGILVLSPGRPGIAARNWALISLFFDPEVAPKYDWIGFDVRGTGQLGCDESLLADRPAPPYSPEYAYEWLERSEAYAEGCYDKMKEILPHITHANNVRDLESIRIALGADTMNFYGVSFGTILGQLYIDMYPDTVGLFVFDSARDPDRGNYDYNLDQNYAADVVFDLFFTWLADQSDFYGLGTTKEETRETYLQIKSDLEENPALDYVGSAEWTEMSFDLIEYHTTWTTQAELMRSWVVDRNETFMRENYVGVGTDQSVASFLILTCRDPLHGGWETFDEASIDFRRGFEDGAQYTTYYNAYFWGGPCYFWPVGPVEDFKQPKRDYTTKALFIHTEYDAFMPYEGALAARELFRESSLVKITGAAGQVLSVFSGQLCVESLIAKYLDTGVLPARMSARYEADYECPSDVPFPDPAGDAAAGDGDGRRRVNEQTTSGIGTNNRKLPEKYAQFEESLKEELIRSLRHH